MLKEPVAGRVKTRLGRQVGMTTAAWWFRHQVRRLLREVQDPRWRVVLSVSPDTAVTSRAWPAHLPRLPQGGGDLGRRMERALTGTPGRVVLIGGDIPGVRRHIISDAFQKLGGAASVIGPASDGGFWLVGLRNGVRRHPPLFQGVRWSEPDTCARTVQTLPTPVARAAELRDIDTLDDLERLKSG